MLENNKKTKWIAKQKMALRKFLLKMRKPLDFNKEKNPIDNNNLIPKTVWQCKLKKQNLEKELSSLGLELAKILDETNLDQEKIKIIKDRSLEINNQISFLDQKISEIIGTPTSPQKIKYSAKTIRLGKFYQISKLWQKFLLVGLLSVISSLVVWLMLQNTGIYSAGVSGIIQGIARIVKNSLEKSHLVSTSDINIIYNILFWVTYVVVNIPLLIFSYYKIGRQFTILTAFYLSLSNILGFLINLIPNSQTVLIFGRVLEVSQTVLMWTVSSISQTGSVNAIVSMFVYGTVYGLFTGIYLSILYIIGSSTGGTDIPAYYTQKRKNKSIGLLLTYFNLFSLLIGIILGSFVTFLIDTPNAAPSEILQAFFSPNLIVSVLGTILMGIIIIYFFPKTKLVKVQVYSTKVTQITSELLSKKWIYKIIINKTEEHDSFSVKETNSFETICLYIDLPQLIQDIRKVDENESLITIYPTVGIDGDIPTTHYIK